MSNDLYPDLFADISFCYVHSYNHWWDRFPRLRVLCPLYQARFWILMDEVTLGFILYIQYNTEEVEQRETTQRLRMACLFIWVNLFCVRVNEWKTIYCSCLNEHFGFLLYSSLFFQPDIILFLCDPNISPECHLTVYLNLPDVCRCT